MGMTPIARIPFEADSPPLHTIVKGELDSLGRYRGIAQALEDAITHDQKEDSLSVMLDWAMQIRNEMGISWGESIDAAMILFYG